MKSIVDGKRQKKELLLSMTLRPRLIIEIKTSTIANKWMKNNKLLVMRAILMRRQLKRL